MTPSPGGFILGHLLATFSEEGIREASRNHESLFRWPGVLRVHTTPKHIFVMVDNTAGIILPNTAFGSDQERAQFVGEVQKWIDGSRGR